MVLVVDDCCVVDALESLGRYGMEPGGSLSCSLHDPFGKSEMG